jgi:hypothetical protein
MKFNPVLIQILSEKNFDYFYAIELRAAYMAVHSDKKLSPSSTLRLVYSELAKLVRKGLLRKSISKKNEKTTFIKTDLFKNSEIITEYLKMEENNSKEDAISIGSLEDSLKSRLDKYKNELLISTSESSEYLELCTDFPELTKQLKNKYDSSCDKSSTFQGKIKAVENLINDVKL